MNEQAMADLRRAVKEAFDAVIESDSPLVMDESDFARQVRDAMAAEASAKGGQDEAVAWVKEKLEMLAQHKPVPVPTFPTLHRFTPMARDQATRPPTQAPPARFQGVK